MKIIPVFIPHAGCPYRCIYCDQRKISGVSKTPSPDEIDSIIEKDLKTIPEGERVEVAFFGGTFTLLKEVIQQKYLEAVYPYVKNKKISGIRMSTHPEAVTENSIKLFKKRGGCLVELGVQSLDEEVLRKSRRAMDFNIIKKAADIIKKSGMDLGVQVMLGLPGDTLRKSIKTAQKLLSLGPKTARIYPAIVLEGTRLGELFKKGRYTPLSTENAIEWSARISEVFEKKAVKVIRIGLHPSEDLNSKGIVLAGPYHPNFGEMARARQIRNKIMNILGKKKIANRKAIEIHAPKNIFNLISGYKRFEKKFLEDSYGVPILLHEAPAGGLFRSAIGIETRSPNGIKVKIKDIRKDIAIINPRMPIEAKIRLRQMGYYVAEVPLHPKLPGPIKGHPDMMLFSHRKKVIYEPSLEDIAGLLRDNGYECIRGESIKSHEYPKDIIYNACSIGEFIIRYNGKIEKHIENIKAKFIRVKQGYVKCSIVSIDRQYIIISDEGICDKWNTARGGCDSSLHITAGHIKLPGYKTGFIGGSSGAHKDKIFFIGSLKNHPDGRLIRDFIENRNKKVIELYNGELCDVGSILFFEPLLLTFGDRNLIRSPNVIG